MTPPHVTLFTVDLHSREEIMHGAVPRDMIDRERYKYGGVRGGDCGGRAPGAVRRHYDAVAR